ncbi:MAG: hypothetical protein E7165_01980 [Firmicutes bacterium]|nr:hypothetical protein [Bacillota bacterium]
MAKLYKDIFADMIKEQINNGEFKTKQELIHFLHNFNTNYFNNPTLMQKLKQAGINLKELNINEVTQELLAYYDRSKTDTSSLDLQGITQVEIDGKDYIKRTDSNGNTQLLDDSLNKNNFVDQFTTRQNESYRYQSDNGVKNADEIFDDMKKDKADVKLTASTNQRNLTLEESAEFATVMGMSDASRINFIVDPTRNIYINKDNGDIFYVHRDENGKLVVKKAVEATAETVKTNGDDALNDITVTQEKSNEINFELLSDSDLEYIAENRMGSLTPEQQRTLSEIRQRRSERTVPVEMNQNEKQSELGHQKVLKLDLNKPYNGFTSILYLSLISFTFGMGAFLYLLIKIYM